MKVVRRSMITGVEHTREIDATEEQFINYRGGMLLQDAFPNLSDEDREFIKSGITPEEWEHHVAYDDEE